MAYLLLLIPFAGVAAGVLWFFHDRAAYRRQERRRLHHPAGNVFNSRPVRAHVPGTNRYGKTSSLVQGSAAHSCSSCGSSVIAQAVDVSSSKQSSPSAVQGGGGKFGGGGASAGIPDPSPKGDCSTDTSCSSCGGGGGD